MRVSNEDIMTEFMVRPMFSLGNTSTSKRKLLCLLYFLASSKLASCLKRSGVNICSDYTYSETDGSELLLNAAQTIVCELVRIIEPSLIS